MKTKIRVLNFLNKFATQDFLTIFLLFFLSFILRIFYVNVDSPYVFHPDEKTIVDSTINLRYNLNPKHFDWPTLTYYINYPLYNVLERTEAKILRDYNLTLNLVSEYNYYCLTRGLVSLLGSLGVVFLLLTIRNFTKEKNLSIFIGAVFSLMPFYLFRSSQALPDVPMVFFGIVSLYFISKHYLNSKIIFLILSSLFLGFSISSKYTGYFFGVTLFLYILFFSSSIKQKLRNLIVSGIFILLGFLIGTPYALLDYNTFLISDSPKGALWQFSNVGKSDFFEHLTLFFKNLLFNDLGNYGYLPQVVVIIFLIYLTIQKYYYHSKIDIGMDYKLFVIFIIQYFYIFWSVSGISENSQRAQHFLPVYIFLMLILATFFIKFSSLKIKVIFLCFFLILNSPLYLERLEERPIVKLSKRLENKGNPKEIEVAYNYSDFKVVLQKLEYKIDKFDERNIKISDNVKYIFSSVELCQSDIYCDYSFLAEEVNVFNLEKVILYEKK